MISFNTSSYLPALPEIFMLVMCCFILLAGVFISSSAVVRRVSFNLAQFTLIASAVLVIHGFELQQFVTTFAFDHSFVLDKLSASLIVFVNIAMAMTFWYSHLYNEENGIPANEFYVLGLLSTLGMMVLLSASSFVTLFLGLELMTLPIYTMVALMRGKLRCIEASMKYFVMGSVASALFLYGVSMFFGATRSLDIYQVAQVIAATPADQSFMLYFGLVFVLVGIAFKLGAAPFHNWVPDVYDGAPNSVTLLISAAPKIAAFGLMVRFLVYAVPTLHVQWQEVLLAMGIISIVLGNVVAIIQTNIKRMLAYSSIAQIGYIILGLACATQRGDAAAMFYMVSYALTSLGAFGMLLLMSKAGYDANEITDFAGLNARNPWIAFMMLLVLFSLAGIPPLVGFIAKVGILEALINVHLVWVAAVAIIFAIIGSYYYIRVVKVMYFEEPEKSHEVVRCPANMVTAISINGLAVLLLGIFPSQLFLLCHSVFLTV